MKLIKLLILLCVIFNIHHSFSQEENLKKKTRIILTSDAEIDDECSFVRCLLYANDFDIEGIITTSSQYHAHDHNWAGDDWYVKYLEDQIPLKLSHSWEMLKQRVKWIQLLPARNTLSRCFWTQRTIVPSGSRPGEA